MYSTLALTSASISKMKDYRHEPPHRLTWREHWSTVKQALQQCPQPSLCSSHQVEKWAPSETPGVSPQTANQWTGFCLRFLFCWLFHFAMSEVEPRTLFRYIRSLHKSCYLTESKQQNLNDRPRPPRCRSTLQLELTVVHYTTPQYKHNRFYSVKDSKSWRFSFSTFAATPREGAIGSLRELVEWLC